MIKYILNCSNNHEFESWFSNSSEFDKLKKKKLLECIYCRDSKVEKSIMSPKVLNKKIDVLYPNLKKIEEFKKIKKNLKKIKKYVEKNFEYVGDKLSKEVRNIYYDKKTNKNIYGTATKEEREELQEEGIELATIPWIDDKEN
jgi:hypothetical protein